MQGFEVVPIGVTRRAMQMYGVRGESAADFQMLARKMGVDAVVVGTVNDYSPYYPPRLAMTVRWYAANPSFHPIPAGYGLPWGTPAEEVIPERHLKQAEFELAKRQLATQTPPIPPEYFAAQPSTEPARAAQHSTAAPVPLSALPGADGPAAGGGELPADWPDPRGFVPPPPSSQPPCFTPQHEAILTHTRSYNGHDLEVTEALADYYELRDDARFGGWQAYLQRSEDFIRFCCYKHVTEMLAMRGGADETKVVYRRLIGRYDP